MNEMRVPILGEIMAGLFFLLGVGFLLVKGAGIPPIHFAGGLLFAAIFYWIYVICRMVSTGKVKAKGAKKRRAQLLPYFYHKRGKFSKEAGTDTFLTEELPA